MALEKNSTWKLYQHKAGTGMQCGSSAIDIPKTCKAGEQISDFTLMQQLVLDVTVVKLLVMSK